MRDNEKGFALLEVMIALAILTIGLLGVMMMQINAINSNSSSMHRTDANAIARSFIDRLRILQSSATSGTVIPSLTVTNANDQTADNSGKLNNGYSPGYGSPDPTKADHQLAAATGAGNQQIGLSALFPVSVYTFSKGLLIDNSGRSYQVFWNVDDDPWPGSGSKPYRTVRIFLYWNTAMGTRHLEYTAQI